MPSLSELVGAAKSAAKQPVTQVGTDIRTAVQYGIAKGTYGVTTASRNVVQAGVSGVLGAATQAITGDVAGAAKTLQDLPSKMVNSVLGAKATKLLSSTGAASLIEGNPYAGINARQDAVLNFNWYASFPAIDGIVLPWYYCERANLSWRNIETQQVYRRGHQETLPKSYSVAPLKLSFMVDDSCSAMTYLTTWQSKVLSLYEGSNSRQGMWGRPSDFWKKISIYVLSVNKQKVVEFIYYDAWPSNPDSWELVSDAQGRLFMEVEFPVNDVVHNFYSVSPTSKLSTIGGAVSQVGTVNSVIQAAAQRVAGTLTSGSSLASTVSKFLF